MQGSPDFNPTLTPFLSAFLSGLQRLPVHLQDSHASVFELHAIAIRHQLTSYDALYHEAALATGLPLATRGKALQQAAAECGVGVWSA